MHRAIVGDQTPNLFLLHYRVPQLVVESVLVIPHFAFSLSCVEKRKALSPLAVRKGYVGCYFLLDRIPSDAKISVVDSGKAISPAMVRKAYEKVRPLEKLNIEKRGWTLDVLNVLRSLNKNEFALSEVYDHADELAGLHPQNHHIHDKIRQQLQVLRDLGLLEFLGAGSYRLR
jgi:type II restriction enzyme